jgi:formiminotetrahydrofolate cyclodeaminase
VESLDAYLEQLASNEPTPGGGSAAALVGAVAAALVAMVGRIAKSAPDDLVARADELRPKLLDARARDEAAYAAVVAAQALPKRTQDERITRARVLEEALAGAACAPLQTAALALDVLRLVEQLLNISMGALESDVASAAEFAYAALTACGYNVRVNHRYMRDEMTIRRQALELVKYEGEGAQILKHARHAVAKD